MLSVAEARQNVIAECRPAPTEATPLAQAVGRRLAAAAVAAGDLPPYDKSMMDGYAVQAAEMASGVAELDVLEVIAAGGSPTQAMRAGGASRIMTGAPLPSGADGVVIVEHSQITLGEETAPRRVRLTGAIAAGENVMPRGGVVRSGQTILPAGARLTPPRIALLAEIGVAAPVVHRAPRVAVVATGDELVDAAAAPGDAQIRNSNGPLLVASAEAAGAETKDLGIVRDQEAELGDAIDRALQCDVVLLTGGVSAGMFDLVPKMLQRRGVRQVFHKVNLKPGKPVWFGVRDDAGRRTVVFGLPGNPVSTLVCFELFVRPALRVLQGVAPEQAVGGRLRATLRSAHRIGGDRPTYFPARLLLTDGGVLADPLPWKGSSDQTVLADAGGFIFFPTAGEYAAGDTVEVAPLPGAWDE